MPRQKAAPTSGKAKTKAKAQTLAAHELSSYQLARLGQEDAVDYVCDAIRDSDLRSEILDRMTVVLNENDDDDVHDRIADRATAILDMVVSRISTVLTADAKRLAGLLGDKNERIIPMLRAVYRGEVDPDNVPEAYGVLYRLVEHGFDFRDSPSDIFPDVLVGLTYVVATSGAQASIGLNVGQHLESPVTAGEVSEDESSPIASALHFLLRTLVGGKDAGFFDEARVYHEPSAFTPKEYDRIAREYAAQPLGYRTIEPSYRMRWHGMQLLGASRIDQPGFTFGKRADPAEHRKLVNQVLLLREAVEAEKPSPAQARDPVWKAQHAEIMQAAFHGADRVHQMTTAELQARIEEITRLRREAADSDEAVQVTVLGPDRGRFDGTVLLYRVIDEFELKLLAHAYQHGRGPATRIEGGHWATNREREGGASFGTDPDRIVRWAYHWSQGSRPRLVPPLYLIQVEGRGREFVREDLDRALRGPGHLPLSACSPELGCSIRPEVQDVRSAWALDGAERRTPIHFEKLLQAINPGDAHHAAHAIAVLDTALTSWSTLYRRLEEIRAKAETAQIKRLLTQRQALITTDLRRAAEIVRTERPGDPILGAWRNALERDIALAPTWKGWKAALTPS